MYFYDKKCPVKMVGTEKIGYPLAWPCSDYRTYKCSFKRVKVV